MYVFFTQRVAWQMHTFLNKYISRTETASIAFSIVYNELKSVICNNLSVCFRFWCGNIIESWLGVVSIKIMTWRWDKFPCFWPISPKRWSTLGKISSRRHFEIFFPRKRVLTVYANFLQWRQFAWNVKSCFLGKIRKKCYQFVVS